MTRWRSFLAVLGLVGGSYAVYLYQTGNGTIGPPRSRDGRGRVGREGPASTEVALALSLSLSTVTATTPVVANNSSTTTVTITVKDSSGAAMAGVTPSLASSGTGNTVVQPAATDGSGVTTGTVRSSVSELKTMTATITGVGDITQTASVWFVPLFEFAGLDGGGMGVVCAGTTPTGSRSEALTFTRASSAYCTKTSGSSLSGIANGDLVLLTTDQPRVMTGNSAGLGLDVFRARTNTALHSSEIDNAYWAKTGAPTVTADYAVGPDGASTADRVQFAATTATQESEFYNTADGSCPAAGGVITGSFYLKGTSGSGSISLVIGTASSCGSGTLFGAYCVKECPFNASTWTRCVNDAITNINRNILIGNESFLAGHTGSQPAADVLIAKVQCEAGRTVSPPLDTTTVAVTSAAEVATFTTVTVASGAASSVASSVVLGPYKVSGTAALSLYADTTHYRSSLINGQDAAPGRCDFRISSIDSIDTAANVTLSAENRLRCYHDGAGRDGGSCLAGVCATATTQNAAVATEFDIGHMAGASQIDGTIKKVCKDSISGGCI